MAASTRPGAQRRRLALAVTVGQTVEYYDFLLYASAAAAVFGPLFFPSADARASTLASFATFAIGFLFRPLGAVLFGHLADRVGRRPVLLATLLLMGFATTAIGLLPTHAQAGVVAPALLVVMRCLQGLSLGGEWGSAALLAVEHAPRGRRSFFGSLPQVGSALGLVLSTAVLLAARQLPPEDFRSWGWRIPFLLTAPLVAVGVAARLRVEESPEFVSARRSQQLHRAPVLEVVRRSHVPLLLGLLTAGVTTAGYYLVNTFTISYSVQQLGLSADVGLVGQLLTGTTQAVLVPVVGLLALRRDVRRAVATSSALLALWSFPLYALMQSGSAAAVWLGQVVATLFLTGVWALLPALLAAQFPTEVRCTGLSIAVQGAAVLGGTAPYTATWLLGESGGSPWPVAALLCAVAAASALGAVGLRRPVEPAPPDVVVPGQRREAGIEVAAD